MTQHTPKPPPERFNLAAHLLALTPLPAEQAIRFVLAHPGVSSLIVGGLSLEHLKANLAAARSPS